MQQRTGRRIFGLDLMRAVAISLVVFSHIVWIIPNVTGSIPQIMSVCGVIGVEMFFVLSGFLIGRIIYAFFTAEDFRFKDVTYFWYRRWFRTLPNYYFALIVNILIVIYIGNQLPRNVWQYGLFIQNLAWEIPSFFYESWSLSIEEFAYIIGPLVMYGLMLLIPKVSRSKLFLYATLIIILIFMLTKTWYNAKHIETDMIFWNVNLKASIIYRIDAVYYGALAAYISITKQQFWKRIRFVSFALGFLLFGILILGIPYKRIFIEQYPAFWNIWYLPINGIAIALTLPMLSLWKTVPELIRRAIKTVSRVSYAMYVLHYSIILQLLKYFIPTDNLYGLDIVIYIMVYVSLVFVLAYMLYVFFEKPITNLRDHPKIRSGFY